MAVRKQKKCDKCGEVFLRAEMIEYTPVGCKNMKVFCKPCYEERIAYDKFSDGVCKIFGLKRPGPILNTQRKALLNKGYTDEIILDCLDYVYNVKKLKKSSETLVLVTPENINAMLKYKKVNENRTNQLVNAMVSTQTVTHIVPVRENTKTLKQQWNSDEWLDFD